MILAVDIGNTRTKAALFDDEKIKKVFFLNSADDVIPEEIIKYVKKVIVSDVGNKSDAFLKAHTFGQKPIMLSNRLNLPVTIAYQSPETLGNDRLALSCASHNLFPESNCLTIDIGTCITYDYTDKYAVYHGGAISPGIYMRLKGMHNYSARLPLVEPIKDVPLIGKTTEESILSGVINGITEEINGTISTYSVRYKEINVLITGGDTKYFEDRLKKPIFAHPNLVLWGLYTIAQLNE